MYPLRLIVWFMFSLCVIATIILYINLHRSFLVIDKKFYSEILFKETEPMKIASYEAHLLERGFNYEQIGNMSLLGKWLLTPEGSSLPINDPKNSYLILIWQYGRSLENRHIKHYSNEKHSPWDNCSVQNCVLSYKSEDLHRADAVVFHVQFMGSASKMPTRSRVDQRWIILMDESPMNLLSSSQKTSEYDGLFNWTMTYRTDSDVPVPYGRTVKRTSKNNCWASKASWETNDIINTKSKLLAVMISHCSGKNRRITYIKRLKMLLQDRLDIIGRCENGNSTVCQGHFAKDCPVLSSYKFYLSFENSNCREYITEKVFWNAFQKYAVPIIMGAPLADCQRLLPPDSYIHVDSFPSVDQLAEYLLYLDRNDDRYLKYHEWRDGYVVLNEHGYFGSSSKHYCRVCEALNYNSNATKIYRRLGDVWDKKRDCAPTSYDAVSNFTRSRRGPSSVISVPKIFIT